MNLSVKYPAEGTLTVVDPPGDANVTPAGGWLITTVGIGAVTATVKLESAVTGPFLSIVVTLTV